MSEEEIATRLTVAWIAECKPHVSLNDVINAYHTILNGIKDKENSNDR